MPWTCAPATGSIQSAVTQRFELGQSFSNLLD